MRTCSFSMATTLSIMVVFTNFTFHESVAVDVTKSLVEVNQA